MHIIHTLWQPVYFSGQPVVFCRVVFVPPLRPFRFGLFFPLIPDTRWNHRTAMAPGWSASATGQGHGLPKRNECNLYHDGYMNPEEIPSEWGQRGPVQKCSCGPLDFLDCLSLCFVYGNELTRKSNHFLATSLSIRAPWSSHCYASMFISGVPYLLHSFNRVVNSCNLWFKSFDQTVAQLYMYVCLNMYMHIMYMCHI